MIVADLITDILETMMPDTDNFIHTFIKRSIQKKNQRAPMCYKRKKSKTSQISVYRLKQKMLYCISRFGFKIFRMRISRLSISQCIK